MGHGLRLLLRMGLREYGTPILARNYKPYRVINMLCSALHLARMVPESLLPVRTGPQKYGMCDWRVLFTLDHTDWATSVVFSPDGKIIATTGGTSRTAILWDALTGKKLFSLTDHKDYIGQVVFSPDGTRLATASRDGSAKVWDAVSGKELFTLWGHDGTVFSVAFSPDGKTIATASADKTAKLWDAFTGKELFTLNAPDGSQV